MTGRRVTSEDIDVDRMKTIQVIDGAQNCAYDLFEASERLFEFLFPDDADIAFIEEIEDEKATFDIDKEFNDMWDRPVNKKKARGISGTLFYDLYHKKDYYPNRRESDLDLTGRAFRLEEAGSGEQT